MALLFCLGHRPKTAMASCLPYLIVLPNVVALIFLLFTPNVVPGGYKSSKVGIRNLSPHLRNSAILRTTILIAELRTEKSCGTTIADLQNLTSAIPQLSPVSCQSATF
jgi:hypothetical protein